VLVLSC